MWDGQTKLTHADWGLFCQTWEEWHRHRGASMASAYAVYRWQHSPLWWTELERDQWALVGTEGNREIFLHSSNGLHMNLKILMQVRILALNLTTFELSSSGSSQIHSMYQITLCGMWSMCGIDLEGRWRSTCNGSFWHFSSRRRATCTTFIVLQALMKPAWFVVNGTMSQVGGWQFSQSFSSCERRSGSVGRLHIQQGCLSSSRLGLSCCIAIGQESFAQQSLWRSTRANQPDSISLFPGFSGSVIRIYCLAWLHLFQCLGTLFMHNQLHRSKSYGCLWDQRMWVFLRGNPLNVHTPASDDLPPIVDSPLSSFSPQDFLISSAG